MRSAPRRSTSSSVTGNETAGLRRQRGSCRSRCAISLDAYRTVTERRLVECYHDAHHRARAGAADVQSRAAVARIPRARRAALLGDVRQGARLLPQARPRARGARRARVHPLATPTSATSRCSSRCRTAGPSTSCFPSCRSTAWTSGPPAPACWRTSPATRTARSTASCPCAT